MFQNSIDGSTSHFGLLVQVGLCEGLPVYLPGEYLATCVGKCLSRYAIVTCSTSWGWWLISVTLATGELVLWIVGGRGSLGGAGYVEPASALSLASTWAPCGSTW